MPGLANGLFCCGPSLIVTVSFCLSLTSTSLCNFLELDEDNVLSSRIIRVSSIGFWCFENLDGDRFSYGDRLESRMDDKFTAARGLGTTGNVLGFLTWVIYLFAACLPYPPEVMLALAILCVLTAFFEGMKLLMFRSTGFCEGDFLGCGLDAGANCTIAAILLWLLAGALSAAHFFERKQAKKKAEEEG